MARTPRLSKDVPLVPAIGVLLLMSIASLGGAQLPRFVNPEVGFGGAAALEDHGCAGCLVEQSPGGSFVARLGIRPVEVIGGGLEFRNFSDFTGSAMHFYLATVEIHPVPLRFLRGLYVSLGRGTGAGATSTSSGSPASGSSESHLTLHHAARSRGYGWQLGSDPHLYLTPFFVTSWIGPGAAEDNSCSSISGCSTRTTPSNYQLRAKQFGIMVIFH
jgi:hypothetical protein